MLVTKEKRDPVEWDQREEHEKETRTDVDRSARNLMNQAHLQQKFINQVLSQKKLVNQVHSEEKRMDAVHCRKRVQLGIHEKRDSAVPNITTCFENATRY